MTVVLIIKTDQSDPAPTEPNTPTEEELEEMARDAWSIERQRDILSYCTTTCSI